MQKVGEGNYTGEQDDLFIEIDDVFSDGLDLTGKKKLFDEFIKKHNFETIGDFGLIGGIEVWQLCITAIVRIVAVKHAE